ncbi:MAG: hypothetical protein M5U28_54915 [Sandaracinaceae bacterium]|nr:hypothetical protein [Sandaracinaceae bacterium]
MICSSPFSSRTFVYMRSPEVTTASLTSSGTVHGRGDPKRIVLQR